MTEIAALSGQEYVDEYASRRHVTGKRPGSAPGLPMRPPDGLPVDAPTAARSGPLFVTGWKPSRTHSPSTLALCGTT